MFFKKNKKEKTVIDEKQLPKEPKIEIVTKLYHVTGISHYLDALENLKIYNDDYELNKEEIIDEYLDEECIYEYVFYPNNVELVPEPDHPYDNKAIKVVVDGYHIGYIESDSCSHIHNLLNENRIVKMECDIHGGKYKYVGCDENDNYYLKQDTDPYEARLYIKEKIDK